MHDQPALNFNVKQPDGSCAMEETDGFWAGGAFMSFAKPRAVPKLPVIPLG
jgi:hypothetical protein